MALITCPECGQKVSDTAKVCVHCGFDLKGMIQNTEMQTQKPLAEAEQKKIDNTCATQVNVTKKNTEGDAVSLYKEWEKQDKYWKYISSRWIKIGISLLGGLFFIIGLAQVFSWVKGVFELEEIEKEIAKAIYRSKLDEGMGWLYASMVFFGLEIIYKLVREIYPLIVLMKWLPNCGKDYKTILKNDSKIYFKRTREFIMSRLVFKAAFWVDMTKEKYIYIAFLVVQCVGTFLFGFAEIKMISCLTLGASGGVWMMFIIIAVIIWIFSCIGLNRIDKGEAMWRQNNIMNIS